MPQKLTLFSQIKNSAFNFCFVLLLFSPFVQYDFTVITLLFSIKYVSRVNFDSTNHKMKVENIILRFLPLKYSAT